GQPEAPYQIAGDRYAYALNGDELHFAAFDAMGHRKAASRLANLAMTSYRHSRRLDHDLPTTYRAMDEAVANAFGEDVFVTAHLGQLDLGTGMLSIVNAGHPRPILIRSGTAHEMQFPPATP